MEPDQIKLSNPWETFQYLYKNRIKYKKGEFESTAEFKKRIPSWDSDRLIYFSIPVGQDQPTYTYNADKEEITVYGGSVGSINNKRAIGGIRSTVLLNRFQYSDEKKYKATTLFGQKVNVTMLPYASISLSVINYEMLQDGHLMDYGLGSYFRLSFFVPKIAAKGLAKDFILVLGVTINSFNDAIEGELIERKPEIDSPYHIYEYNYGLIATVNKLLVIDKVSSTVWKTVSVNEKRPLTQAKEG